MRFELLPVSVFVFADSKKGWAEHMADELKDTAKILRAGGAARIPSVAWRLADVAADLVNKANREGLVRVEGIHTFSGKGGKLSRQKTSAKTTGGRL